MPVKRQQVRNDRRARSAVHEIIDKALDRDQRLGLRLEAGRGCERRQPAHAPGPARQLCNCIAERRRIAALEAVRDDHDRGAAGISAEPGHGEEGLQRIADAGAAVPIADQEGSRVQRLLAALQPQR